LVRTLELAGVQVPVIGQGTWHMGEDRAAHTREVAALRQGIELGMTLIDTAEMYAEGGAETVVGQAIAGLRDRVFLVSKVYPHNASRTGIPQACRPASALNRLHRPLSAALARPVPLEETVEAFERLRADGKIGRWGVSNFDVDDLEELSSSACATNQVLYNLEERGIEFDLLPWSQQQRMPLMAYCPIGQGWCDARRAGTEHDCRSSRRDPAQVSLAWILRQDGVIAIPRLSPEHVQLNAQAAQLQLEAGIWRRWTRYSRRHNASSGWRWSESLAAGEGFVMRSTDQYDPFHLQRFVRPRTRCSNGSSANSTRAANAATGCGLCSRSSPAWEAARCPDASPFSPPRKHRPIWPTTCSARGCAPARRGAEHPAALDCRDFRPSR
jgi:diketogulonate reductase-like aldo/keto reductase